jgi:hypothetical protein
LASDYLSRKLLAPQYIVKPIIPRGRLILLVGNSTQGKTPFICQLARDIAAGNPILDYFPCSGPSNVGLFDAESAEEDITMRLQMQEHRKADIGKLRIWNSSEIHQGFLSLTQAGLQNMRAIAEDSKLDVLLLDNLFALSGGIDVTKGNLLQPVLSGLRQITHLPHRPSVLLCHHPRKGGREDKRPNILVPDFTRWLEEASGSYLLVNLTDVRLGIERVETHGEELTVFRGRSRVPGEEQDIGPLYLTIDEEHALAAIDHRPQVLEDAGLKINQVLDELRPLDRFTKKEAKKLCARLDVSGKTVLRALQFAQGHGLIRESEPEVFQWRRS